MFDDKKSLKERNINPYEQWVTDDYKKVFIFR